MTQPIRLILPDLFQDRLAKLTEHAAHVDMIIGAVAQHGLGVAPVGLPVGLHSAISDSHLTSFLGSRSFDPQALDKAEGAARHALSLERDLADTRAPLARIAAFRGNWVGARRDYEAALASNPDEPTLHAHHATLLENVGHVRTALAEAREADRLAPGLGIVSVQYSVIYSILGLDHEAVQYADRAINLGVPPDNRVFHIIYSHAAYRRGAMAEAGAQMIQALPADARETGGSDAVELVYAALSDSSRKTAAIDVSDVCRRERASRIQASR